MMLRSYVDRAWSYVDLHLVFCYWCALCGGNFPALMSYEKKLTKYCGWSAGESETLLMYGHIGLHGLGFINRIIYVNYGIQWVFVYALVTLSIGKFCFAYLLEDGDLFTGWR